MNRSVLLNVLFLSSNFAFFAVATASADQVKSCQTEVIRYLEMSIEAQGNSPIRIKQPLPEAWNRISADRKIITEYFDGTIRAYLEDNGQYFRFSSQVSPEAVGDVCKVIGESPNGVHQSVTPKEVYKNSSLVTGTIEIGNPARRYEAVVSNRCFISEQQFANRGYRQKKHGWGRESTLNWRFESEPVIRESNGDQSPNLTQLQPTEISQIDFESARMRSILRLLDINDIGSSLSFEHSLFEFSGSDSEVRTQEQLRASQEIIDNALSMASANGTACSKLNIGFGRTSEHYWNHRGGSRIYTELSQQAEAERVAARQAARAAERAKYSSGDFSTFWGKNEN